MKNTDARQLEREKRLFRYSTALQRGDFETVVAILREARADPLLDDQIAELNAAYEAELNAAHTILSPNQRYREDQSVNITLDQTTSPVNRSWHGTATLAAVVLIVMLAGAVLLTLRSGKPQPSNLSAVEQALSPTPTLIPALTLMPSLPNVAVAAVAPPAQISGALVLCQVQIVTPANLYSRPFSDASTSPILGQLLPPAVADVLDQEYNSATGSTWYFVRSGVNNLLAQGWINADTVVTVSDCPPSFTPTPISVAPVGVFPTVTAMPLMPTPALAAPLQPTVACSSQQMMNNTSHPVEIFSDASLSSPAISSLMPGNSVTVISSSLSDQNELWLLVSSEVEGIGVRGWLPASTVTVVPCTAASFSPTPAATVTLCQVINPGAAVVQVYNQPLSTAETIGLLPPGSPAAVLQQAPGSASGIGWYLITLGIGQGLITGWVQSTDVAQVAICPENGTSPIVTGGIASSAPSGTVYTFVTTTQIGDIPPNTPVITISGNFNGDEMTYQVIAQGSSKAFYAHESQLTYVGNTTPPREFGADADGTSFTLQTTWPIGNIPLGTPVHITSAWYGPFGWVYHIETETGKKSEAMAMDLYWRMDDGACFAQVSGSTPISLYSLPTTDPISQVIGTLGSTGGTQAAVIGQVRGADSMLWYAIQSSTIAWVHQDSVITVGKCPAIPAIYDPTVTPVAP